MAGNLTLAVIKPHIVLSRKVGSVITAIEEAGFGIILAKMLQLRPEGAHELYQEHKGEDSFDDLVKAMTSGPIWVMVLVKDNAVEEWLNTMGASYPSAAAEGTIRHHFGDHHNVMNNAVDGSATDHDARREVNFFFNRELTIAMRIDELEGRPQIE